MTAAVKPAALLELCVASGTTIVVDNTDELRRLERVARAAGADRVGRAATGARARRRP